MSSNYWANSGYILKITDEVLKAFNITKELLIQQWSDEHNIKHCESIMDMIREATYGGEKLHLDFCGNKFSVDIFCVNDDIESADALLDRWEYYMIFDQSDICTIKPTPFLQALQDRNIAPEFKQWVSYG